MSELKDGYQRILEINEIYRYIRETSELTRVSINDLLAKEQTLKTWNEMVRNSKDWLLEEVRYGLNDMGL